jgi:uncharacterized membrane protein YoaK (UPF0700 family)
MFEIHVIHVSSACELVDTGIRRMNRKVALSKHRQLVQEGVGQVSIVRTPRRDGAEGGVHQTLGLGLPLAGVGGFLDAFTYVGHGHVFANAMSGNVVLTALVLQRGDWGGASRTIGAIAAFMLGVVVANSVRLPQVRRVIRRPHSTALLLELIVLGLIGAAPQGVPDGVIVLAVTFVSAVQTSTFRRLGEWAFTSTMSTGNLRSLADALLDWTLGRSKLDARKILHFGTVCVAFFSGAVIGGVTTLRWGDAAAWVAGLLVAICVVQLMMRARSWDAGWRRPALFSKAGGMTRGMPTRTLDPSQEKTS